MRKRKQTQYRFLCTVSWLAWLIQSVGYFRVYAVLLQKALHKIKIRILGVDLVFVELLIDVDGVSSSAYFESGHIF